VHLVELLAVLLVACAGEPERTRPDPPPPAPETPPVAVDEPPPPEPSWVEDPPETPQIALALGAVHSCVLGASGRVSCWGGNEFGELGDPRFDRTYTASRPAPRAVDGLEGAVRIWAASFRTCALTREGRALCFGHGGFGELGQGQRLDSATPVDLGVAHVVELALGEGHTCARRGDRRVFCTGRNSFGQLGDGTIEDRLAPVEVVGLGEVLEIAAGRDHTCARTADGKVSCWGAAFDGQLGDGDRHRPEGYRIAPGEVAGLGDVVDLVAGSDHACALRADRTLACFGNNDSGQLGRGRALRAGLVSFTPSSDFTSVAIGARFGCAGGASSTVCWGANAFGQLGDGTRDGRPEPMAVSGLPGPILALGAGVRHACAALADRSVWCWGSNGRGQLGVMADGEGYRLVPVRVEGFSAD
jgi:alpha-tubulin suppressor-like RCC1 family protein